MVYLSMQEQHELYENARKRVKQKKRLYFHFIVFVLGSIILYVLNELLGYGEQIIDDWFIIAIIIWSFLFAMHLINVFVTNRFMGKEWERKHTEKLVAMQEKRIKKIAEQLDKEVVIQQESDEYNERSKKNFNPDHNK